MADTGDASLLQSDAVAQELPQASLLARLAYLGGDGSPCVVPIWFHWNGTDVVMATLPGGRKVDAIRRHPKVAVSIDTSEWPYKVLTIRGAAEVEQYPGVVPELAQAAHRYLGAEAGDSFLEQYRAWFTDYTWRIAVQAERVTIVDFAGGRLPSNIPGSTAIADTVDRKQ